MADKPRGVIAGGGGHGAVLLEAASAAGEVEIVCVLESDPIRWGKELLGIPIRGGDELMPKLRVGGRDPFSCGPRGNG